MPSFSCTVEDNVPPGLRLDRYIAQYLKLLSRSQIKARDLQAKLNGKPIKISRLLCGGDHLELVWQEEENYNLIPQDLPLDIIYEDNRVIVVNKVQGMVVHPGAGNRQGTLANVLLYRRLEKLKKNGIVDLSNNLGIIRDEINWTDHSSGQRPGIVHRLDKDTSGLIIAAWDAEALAFLAYQFKARKVRKTYAALVRGCPREANGSIDKRIIRSPRNRKIFTVSEKEGRQSVTDYKLVKSYGKYSLLLLRPRTGRTHQIRVHLKYLGTPILGDSLYGQEDLHFRNISLMLHAKRLSLILPDHKSPTTFRTHLPQRFIDIIRYGSPNK